MKNKNKKKFKGVVIDADHILYTVTEGKGNKDGGFKADESDNGFDGFNGKEYKPSLKPYKEQFKAIIHDYLDIIYAQYAGEVGSKVKVVLSGSNNFRFKLDSNYKANRKNLKKSDEYYRLKKWAAKKYIVYNKFEADDIYSHYIKKGFIGVTTDKDCFKGVAGTHFNAHYMHRRFIETSELDARRFNLVQLLMGDASDNIKGLPGIGEKTAIKLLDKFGWNFEGVLKAYELKGLTIEDALLTYRLIDLNQACYDKHNKEFDVCLKQIKDLKFP